VRKTKNKVKNFCTEFIMSDKQSYKICLSMLEKLWEQASKAGQEAQIVIAMRRNEDEIFTITGKLIIERQRRK